MHWTDERIARLKKLWSDGLTTAAIGKQLRVSRNAVAGKIQRLELKRPSPPLKARQKPEPKKSASIRLTLADMSARNCRWPSGDPQHEDFQFCGRAVRDGKPYCAEHCNVAYAVPRALQSV
jgi:GcrA cell cycle regulator